MLKPNGTAIIGMPTSSMAILSLISQILFTTHIKIYEFINPKSKRILTAFLRLVHIVILKQDQFGMT